MNTLSLRSKLILAAIAVLLAIGAAWYFLSSQPAPEPTQMTVQEKKARFKKLIVPVVNEVHQELMAQYQKAQALVQSGEDTDTLNELMQKYKAQTNEQLLAALKPHPRSITIAQAAMESAWATSRFFNEANNIFGVWSFDEDEPRIAASQKRGNKTIYVKKYSSLKKSIQDYYRTLARNDAYKAFRSLKMQTDDPFQLVKKLDRYSEKGAEYGKELSGIIKFNRFDQYDAQ